MQARAIAKDIRMSARKVRLVVDMIHTVFLNVTGGVARLDETQILPPVRLIPFVGTPGRAEFYTPTATARTPTT